MLVLLRLVLCSGADCASAIATAAAGYCDVHDATVAAAAAPAIATLAAVAVMVVLLLVWLWRRLMLLWRLYQILLLVK